MNTGRRKPSRARFARPFLCYFLTTGTICVACAMANVLESALILKPINDRVKAIFCKIDKTLESKPPAHFRSGYNYLENRFEDVLLLFQRGPIC